MPTVTSSAIVRLEYDAMARELQITFVTGKTYVYWYVPRSVYKRLLKAASKGVFFNEHIRDHYMYAQA